MLFILQDSLRHMERACDFVEAVRAADKTARGWQSRFSTSC
ncbi:MAG: hypothetical protein ACM3U2_22355 [Deltaproteobacteria bacterium]